VPTDGATDVAAVSVPDGCGWSAATVATWIDVQTPSGVGSGSVTYTVAANTGATPRTAIIAIGGTAFTVSQAAQAPADLRSRQVSAPPAVAEPGTGWSVTETTENIGTVIAGASTTRFYLSIDTAKGPGDTLLTGTRSVPSLAGGTASTGTITVKIPASVPLGRYYLLACADDTGRVTEQNESNNCVASATPVDVTRPDLVATEVGNPPAVAARGARFSVTDTVANQGGIAVRSSVSRYYLSANPEKGAGDTLLKGTRSVPALAPGATSTKAATLTVPANAPVGGFYLLACADDTELVSESVEANNCIASTAKVTVSRPDLVETMVSPPPASASRGGSFLVTDTVNNQGQVGSRSSVIRYYFSTDASRSAGDRLLTGSRSVRALAAGQSSSGTIRVTIPTATPLGSYFLLACADASDVVEEENEANNCLAATGQVAVSP
jgi:subtilase family serine protease